MSLARVFVSLLPSPWLPVTLPPVYPSIPLWHRFLLQKQNQKVKRQLNCNPLSTCGFCVALQNHRCQFNCDILRSPRARHPHFLPRAGPVPSFNLEWEGKLQTDWGYPKPHCSFSHAQTWFQSVHLLTGTKACHAANVCLKSWEVRMANCKSILFTAFTNSTTNCFLFSHWAPFNELYQAYNGSSEPQMGREHILWASTRVRPCLPHFPALWVWPSYLTSPDLRLLTWALAASPKTEVVKRERCEDHRLRVNTASVQ